MWRLYAVGVVQLALVVLAAILIGIFVVRLPAPRDLEGLSLRFQPLLVHRDALSKALASFRGRHVQISIYDAERRLVASNVEPALTLPSWIVPADLRGHDQAVQHKPPFSLRHPGDGHGRRLGPPLGWLGVPPPFPGPSPDGGPRHQPLMPHTYERLEVDGKDGLLVARFEWPRPSPVPPILTLISGLIVIFVGAALTARWIGSPLKQLSLMAHALGRGDFAARTDMKRADELGDVGRVFNEMAGRIQELLMAEKELLANVAHELRTPLARIRVALEIASESDADVVRNSIGEIAVDLAELESLIDDVLTATRFELGAGKSSKAEFALHLEEISPCTLGARAVERFRTRHSLRPFKFVCADGLPLIEVDPVLFRRVIDNLLENANKYSPVGSHAIDLHVSSSGAGVIFEVVDRGLGVPEHDLARIFNPFFRGERSRSRDTGGVGLGLTLAKRIVEAHGGTITLTSEPGVGTVVRASVPVPIRRHDG